MIKISKGIKISKRGRIKYQAGAFFYQLKLMSHFVAVIHVSPDITLKREMPSIKLMTALFF